jgi:uncharacterized RDD family membrane protein YckC
MQPAPLTRRIVAYLIDVSLFSLPAAFAVWFAAGETLRSAVFRLVTLKRVEPSELGLDPAAGTIPARLLLVLGILLLATGSWTWYRIKCATRGTSTGKRFTSLEIRDANTYALGVSQRQAWRRWAPNQVLALVPIPGIGLFCYLAALRHPQRRGLHDQAGGTIVVKAESRNDAL